MEFSCTPEFQRELKALLKEYPTLMDDLGVLEKFLNSFPRGHVPVIVRISGLGIQAEVYNVKHFRCKALKKGSRSGIRVVYAYLEDEDRIEFVEMYYKKKDDRDCDRERILKYYA